MNEQEKIRELESTIEDLTRHLQIEEQIARMGDRTPYRELESDLASERVKRVEAEALAERWKSVDAVTVTELLAAEATIEQARIEADRLHAWIDTHRTLVLQEKGLVVSGRLQEVLANADTSALARHDAEVAARALRQAADSFDYPDLRWNTTEYETLVKVQKTLRARASTEERTAKEAT